MDLHHLSAYVAVAEELHFSRAARRLFMSQSALSRLIRGLETELGVVLLDRSTRHVFLTLAGSSFLREARLALGQVDIAVQAAQTAGTVLAAALRVGYCDATEVALAEALQAFRIRHPDVALSLEELSRDRLGAATPSDVWDVALCREHVDGPHTRSEHVRNESLYVCLPVTHPLAARRSLTPADLDVGASLILPRGLSPGIRSVSLRRHQGCLTPPEQDVPTFAAAAVLVSAGLGMTIVPGSVCATLGIPGVVFRPLAGEGMLVPLFAVRHHHETSEHVSSFMEALRGTASLHGERTSINETTA